MKALIGSTGFVGGLLALASPYDLLVHRSNLSALQGQALERLVCAGLPAAKWLANRDPAADLANMQSLQEVLSTVTARSVVLISTVDVYAHPRGCTEAHDPQHTPNHPYGRHRLQFEVFIRQRFPHATIVRLPALFGPGLKKNVLYDLLHDNGLDAIQPQSSFQWYPLTQLPQHIAQCEAAGLTLANLCPEPVPTQEILAHFFPDKQVGSDAGAAVHYDVRTAHATSFGGKDGYIMDRAHVLESLGAFIRGAQ